MTAAHTEPKPYTRKPVDRDAGTAVGTVAGMTAVNIPRYSEMVGDTPLVDLTRLLASDARDAGTRLYGKLEFLNPSFSIKDRIILRIFTEAENRGELRKGMTVVCASSGNTGAACAMLCATRGYRAVIITNQKCSDEKMNAIKAYGAELLVAEPHQNYMTMERDLAQENPGWFPVNQYDNAENTLAHEMGTGHEIVRQTQGLVTHFVAGGSTGGTVSGVGRALKKHSASIKVVMADPVGSIFYPYVQDDLCEAEAKSKTSSFLVEGVGKKSIPLAFDKAVVDEVVKVTDTQAFSMCHRLARTEGLCVGGSAGLNIHAAVEVANKVSGGVVVSIIADMGIKYLSKVYNEEWLDTNNVNGQ